MKPFVRFTVKEKNVCLAVTEIISYAQTRKYEIDIMLLSHQDL